MIRLSRFADSAAVIDEDVRETSPSLFGKEFFQIFLDLIGIMVFGEIQSHGKPLDVGIHDDARNIKSGTQNAIGRLSPHPW